MNQNFAEYDCTNLKRPGASEILGNSCWLGSQAELYFCPIMVSIILSARN